MQAIGYQRERAKQAAADDLRQHHDAAQPDHGPGLAFVAFMTSAEKNMAMAGKRARSGGALHVEIFQSRQSSESGTIKVLQVFCNCFKFGNGLVRIARAFFYRLFKTMVDMVMYQGLLCIDDGIFNRLQLLRDFQAATILLQHEDNALEVTFGPFQALDDIGVRRVCSHSSMISSLGGSNNPLLGDRIDFARST